MGTFVIEDKHLDVEYICEYDRETLELIYISGPHPDRVPSWVEHEALDRLIEIRDEEDKLKVSGA